MYDIAIVGGGPAGAALARLIGSRFKVLLLEKRRGQEGVSCKAQEKCCGGLIDPDAQKMLARFRLGIPKEVLLSPQLFAVRVIDIHNSIERYYQRHYINIDREMFDKWLLSIAVHFCTVQTGCVFKSFEEQDDCVIIKYCSEGKEYTERTKLLVGADGAFSMVRRKGFPEVQLPELYVSIQEWYEAEGAQDFYGAIFDEDITDFYSWTIPKENVIILGSAIKAGPGVLQKFELLKKKLEKYGFDFHKFLRRNGAYSCGRRT